MRGYLRGGAPKVIAHHCVQLYQFFAQVNLESINELENASQLTLLNVLKNNKLLTSNAQFDQVLEVLAEQLVTHDKSPLRSLFITLTSEQIRELKSYLQDKGDIIPDFILKATPNVKEQLALYKEQISQLLAYTLKRNQGEHYGPSLLETHSPATRAMAIPYLCNNTPNERSRFASYLETINFTIQSLLITGIPKDLLHTFLEGLQTSAYKECYRQGLKSIDETPTGALFKVLMGEEGIALSELDLDNEMQYSQLHARLFKQEALIYELLQSDVLRQIKTEAAILHSDAYNHVDIVRSCQGLTGTPWNVSTYHQRLHYDAKTALGTDSYIAEGIKAKAPAIIALDFNDTSRFINDLFDGCRNDMPLRSIIDCCAMFKGIDNLTVAVTIARYVKEHPAQFSQPEPLHYVLFFNDAGQLSALPIDGNLNHPSPIVIGSSAPEVINERLGSGPAARFTFYDQSHTVGVDIKQTEGARGLVMMDRNTHYSHFLQGAMRMRGLLEGNQALDLVVPTSLAHQSLEQLFHAMQLSEQQQLQHDNFNAALAQMTNLIRADLMRRLLSLQGEDAAEKKHQFFELAQAYFIEHRDSDLFSQYSSLSKEQPTLKLLRAHQHRLLADWQRLLTLANQAYEADELQLKSTLESIVQQSCQPGVCAERQLSRSVDEGMEVEVANAVQVEVFAQHEIEKETFDPLRREKPYKHWNLLTPPDYKSLQELCTSSGTTMTPDFSKNIVASKNFYQTYKGQKNFLGMYMKPVHALLFKKEEGRLTCTILTQQECEELQPLITSENKADVWISTTQHTLLSGQRPSDFKIDPEYQLIIEQIRYFNGEFNLLLEKEASLDWLAEKTREKLSFFEQYLYPCRETLATHIDQLELMLGVIQQVYKFIAHTPEADRTHFDWSSQFPDLNDADINSCKHLSQAFNKVTSDWWEDDLTKILELEKRALPLRAWGHLDLYVAKLHLLKQTILTLDSNHEQSLVAALSPAQRKELSREYPALEWLLEADTSTNTQEQDHLLLAHLLNEIPITATAPVAMLLRKSTANPYVSTEMLAKVVRAADNEDIFIDVLGQKIISEEIVLLMASNPKVNLNGLQELLDSEKMTEECRCIIARRHNVDDDTLSQLVSSSHSDKVLAAALENKQANEKTFKAIAEHPAASTELLLQVAQKAILSSVIEQCFNRLKEKPIDVIKEIATNERAPTIVLKGLLDKIDTTEFDTYSDDIKSILARLKLKRETHPKFIKRFYTHYADQLLKEIEKEKFCDKDLHQYRLYEAQINEALAGLRSIEEGDKLLAGLTKNPPL